MSTCKTKLSKHKFLFFLMNLISYNVLIYFNYLLTGVLLVVPWFLSSNQTTNIVLSIVAIVLFFVLASSRGVKFPNAEYLSPKIVLLCLMLVGIILPFSNLFLQFSQNSLLIWVTYVVSSLQLASIVITNLNPINDLK